MAIQKILNKPFALTDIREIVERAIARTRPQNGQGPYRSGEHVPDVSSINEQLKSLQANTNARCVLLLSASGYAVSAVGQTKGLDISSVTALVTANFIASSELANLLGSNSSIFKSSYHEGNDYNIMPLPASEFVLTAEYQSLLSAIGPKTVLLLGHTRHPTKGNPTSNNNNHPLLAGPICGIHNGEIHNDDILFNQCGCPRQAEVDSEVIFRLLEPLSPLQFNGTYLSAAQAQLQPLQGDFTFLACDRRAPERLLVVKHHRPLSAYFHPAWNLLTFSSRYIFLRKTFGRAVSTQMLPPDQLLLLEARRLPELGHGPAAVLPLRN